MELKEFFLAQQQLNDVIFDKMRSRGQGAPAMLELMAEDCPSLLRTMWVSRYLTAATIEIAEAQGSLPIKWWSEKSVIDEHNLAVELVDILHFWISACMAAGLSAAQIEDIYFKKLKVNHNRQEERYGSEPKTEDDNKAIKVE